MDERVYFLPDRWQTLILVALFATVHCFCSLIWDWTFLVKVYLHFCVSIFSLLLFWWPFLFAFGFENFSAMVLSTVLMKFAPQKQSTHYFALCFLPLKLFFFLSCMFMCALFFNLHFILSDFVFEIFVLLGNLAHIISVCLPAFTLASTFNNMCSVTFG